MEAYTLGVCMYKAFYHSTSNLSCSRFQANVFRVEREQDFSDLLAYFKSKYIQKRPKSVFLKEVVEGDGDSRLSEYHHTKKVRFKDRSDAFSVDMVVDFVPPSSMTMSWKDKLLGAGSYGAGQGSAVLDGGSDGDFILLDDDVIRSTINGIPAIDFFDRVKQILYKEIEMTVVLKLLERNISYGILFN
ncbi:hypothetical protein J1N35_029890 [Gossypium stocksii]|uniref:Uncharacterized protein n=1 Tax=Gossypium stocksii TaxID=47602 RepID=A0A9D3UYW0_9ROSI|nr:hypothetical protein J1N35_029890 [Gossypium stocksii]